MNGEIIGLATCDPAQPLNLTVTNTNGEIRFVSKPTSQVEFVATCTDRCDEAQDSDFSIVGDGNTITIKHDLNIGSRVSDLAGKIKTQLKEGFDPSKWDVKHLTSFNGPSYDVTVSIPDNLASGSKITARTANGELHIDGANADISFSTANGDQYVRSITGTARVNGANSDVHLDQITGAVNVKTANGDISVTGGEGWVTARTASGDVRIQDYTLKNAKVASVSGDVMIEGATPNAAEYTVDSVSGDVRLDVRVPAQGASLTFKSVSGDKRADGDWTRANGKNAWVIGNGEFGPTFRVKSVSGDLVANGHIDASLTTMNEALPSGLLEDDDDVRAADADAEAAYGEAQAVYAEHQAAYADMYAAHTEAIHGHSLHGHDTGKTKTFTVQAGNAKKEINVDVDAELERAKGWLKDMAGKLSKAVSDLDEAGERRSQQRQGSRDESEPIDGTSASDAGAQDETREIPLVKPESPISPDAPRTPETPESPASPQTPVEPVSPTAERRIRLLEAVQRGEMTVDEALAQLDDNV